MQTLCAWLWSWRGLCGLALWALWPQLALAQEAEESAVETAPEPAGKGPPTAAELLAILQSAPRRPVTVALVVDADSGAVVLDHGASRPIYPASVTKLFSTAAALRSLGPDKVLLTEVRASLQKGGAVDTLVLVGGGDPTLAAADLDQLAQAVRRKGIARVGKLLVDATLFDDRLPKAFDEKQTDAAFRAPVGALQVDVSTLSVVVKPAKAGQPPQVTVTPACGDAVTVRNDARTVAGRKGGVSVTTRAAGKQTEVVVTGSIGAGAAAVFSGRRRVTDSAVFAAGVFRAALERAGVQVQGATAWGKSPAELAVVAERASPSVAKIAATTNKVSQNQYAETLFKLVGATQGGAPSTADKSEAGLKKALADLQIRWANGTIGNGSGLYHAHRVSAQAVVDLLRGMAADAKLAPVWKASLAVGGKDGTLKARLRGGATEGHVFAKTGTLDDVVGLAGYAEGSKHRYVFALFFNDLKGGAPAYRAVHDRLLRRLLAE
jgi:D-alanyl-D-alanine carboxypeptidase/D-alanyl-D-alanine-endopeptidase (penicillin-binding protein 4)